MRRLEKYPINIVPSERDIIIEIIEYSKDNEYSKDSIPSVWQQLLDKKDIVMMNSFEQGFLTSILAEKKEKVPEVWKQLIDMMNKFRKDAGVKITELGNDLIQLIDDSGITFVRDKYEWEK